MEKGLNFAEIPQTAIKVLMSPAQFFKDMPKTGGFIAPLVFMVAMGVVAGLLQSIFSIMKLHVAAGMAGGAASIIIIPIMIAIFGFVGAGILYGIWKLMGSQESYEVAYRCGAYISVLTPIMTILQLIPYLGGVAGIALMTLYLVIASTEVHGLPSRKAWLVFGIIGAVFAFLSLNAEIASRKIVKNVSKFQKQTEEAVEQMQKSAEEMVKQMEMAAEEMQKSTEKMNEEIQKGIEESGQLE